MFPQITVSSEAPGNSLHHMCAPECGENSLHCSHGASTNISVWSWLIHTKIAKGKAEMQQQKIRVWLWRRVLPVDGTSWTSCWVSRLTEPASTTHLSGRNTGRFNSSAMTDDAAPVPLITSTDRTRPFLSIFGPCGQESKNKQLHPLYSFLQFPLKLVMKIPVMLCLWTQQRPRENFPSQEIAVLENTTHFCSFAVRGKKTNKEKEFLQNSGLTNLLMPCLPASPLSAWPSPSFYKFLHSFIL